MLIAAVPQAAGSPSAGVGAGPTAESFVRLTDQTLSCAARALVPTAERHAACLHLKCVMQTACRRSCTAARGGSAPGPKPGRASFYGELGGVAYWPDSESTETDSRERNKGEEPGQRYKMKARQVDNH